MTLNLVELRRGPANRNIWLPPFDFRVTYENDRWWDEPRYRDDDPWFVQVLEDGAEVARVEFDDPGGINLQYENVPPLGPERLEIQFFEVATPARHRGIGARVVQALYELHTDRRLFAYSEEAHGFWASLGWDRFSHPEGDRYYRPLFIQPPTI